MKEAIRFRKTFGLRADEAWIRLVAADPDSEEGRIEYGVSLTPEEFADLAGRSVAVEAIREPVISYGLAHPDDWAGAYIDQQRDGILVAQFSANIEHRQALMSGLGPSARLEILPVQYSLKYLKAQAARIHGTEDWFLTIPAYLESYGVDESANRIHLRVSSVDPRVQDIIEEHFGWPGLTKVESDGTGANLLPFGTLRSRPGTRAAIRPRPCLHGDLRPDGCHRDDPSTDGSTWGLCPRAPLDRLLDPTRTRQPTA